MEELVDRIVTMVLDQADEIAALDAARGEAWASDIMAMARESLGPDGPRMIVDGLAAVGGDGAATALVAIGAITHGLTDDIDPARLGKLPGWARWAGTSRCLEAFEVHGRPGWSMAFRFVDDGGGEHVLLVDLVTGPPEQVGEVQVAAGDLLDATAEPGAGLETTLVEMGMAAARVAEALAATERPSQSAVTNGQLVVARIGPLVSGPILPPEPVPDEVPVLPDVDPEDARYALDLFDRATHPTRARSMDTETGTELARVAEELREAARVDGPLAAWMASGDPIDLDDPAETMVVATVAATISPRRLDHLDPDQREAASVLEWADWLGALIELCREGEGAPVDPSSLVDRVNRCPEVTTSIPLPDRRRVEWAFAVMMEPWPALGVVAEGELTRLGRRLLPSALHIAWERPSEP